MEQNPPVTDGKSNIKLVKFGRYLLLEQIGQGGMADIYKAIVGGVANFTKVVVIKKIHLRLSSDPVFVEMFVREANMVASLQHSNIVQVFELGEADGQQYIAMEYIHGRDLRRIMARANKMGVKVPLEVALRVVSEVAKALWFAYNAKDPYGKPMKIIHRDVSPSNVMVSFAGEVKIMDFGVAKAATYKEKETGRLSGKLGYMSPEQIKGKPVDHRSDIFSLGIILFELLTLHRLFAGKSDLRTVMNVQKADIDSKLKQHPEIPNEVQDILRRFLAKDPDDRYQTAQEVIADIKAYTSKAGLPQDTNIISGFVRKLFAEESQEEILPEGLTAEIIKKIEAAKAEESRTTQVRQLVEKPASQTTNPKEDSESGYEATSSHSTRPGTEMPWATNTASKPAPEGTAHFLETSTFKLKTRNDKTFGPISYEQLLTMIQAGSVSQDEMCSVNNGAWIKLGNIRPLRSKFVTGSEQEGEVTYKGHFNRFAFPRILYKILTKGPTKGRLVVKNMGVQKELDFKQGHIRVIKSNIKKELLGNYLLSHGIISLEDLQKAVELATEKRLMLGDALIRLGMIQPHEMVEHLQGQMKAKFMELFTWTDGQFSFIENVEPRHQAVQLDLDPVTSMMEAVRKLFTLDELSRIIGPYLNTPLEKEANPKWKLDSLSLTARELRAAHLLGINKIPQKALEATVGPYDWRLIVYRITFMLVQLGFYRFGQASNQPE